MKFEELQKLLQNRIIQLMYSNDLSMNQLSHLLEKSPDYIQKVISGRITPPLSVIVDICNLFDITPAELFDTAIVQPQKQQKLLRLLKYLPEQQIDGLILLFTEK